MIEPSDKERPSLSSPAVMLATWFGSGYLPKAPGTWGSLAALPVAWVVVEAHGSLWLLGGCIGLFVVGIWASNGYMDKSGTHDPGPVVIDEVVGQCLVLCVVPLTLPWYLFGFAAFRLFDIAKPWPIYQMDKNVHGGLGVMLDDVGAAIYAIAVMLTALYALDYLV